MRIAEIYVGSVKINLETPVTTLVRRDLSQHPELVVSLAKVRAAEDKIKAIKASYFPKIAALANVGYGEERVSIGSNTIDSMRRLLAPVLRSSCRFSTDS